MSKDHIRLQRLPTTKPNQFIDLKVYYSKGGVNFFSGNSEKRGHWCSTGPVEVIDEGRGYACERHTLGGDMGGIKSFIEETARFNLKKLQTLALQWETMPQLARILAKTLEKTKLELTPEAKQTVAKLLTHLNDPNHAANGNAPQKLPDTIATIIQQCGGRGISGAFVYIGADQFVHKCAEAEGECRPNYASRQTPEGLVDYDVGLQFSVNGKPREGWKMVIAYEPDDTYSVWLWRKPTPTEQAAGKMGAVLEHSTDVYCDNLKEVVENMYDRNIKSHNQGFIPLAA